MYTFSIIIAAAIFTGGKWRQVVAFVPAKCNFGQIAMHATPTPSSLDERPSPPSSQEQAALIDGLNKMNHVMSSDFFKLSPVLKQFYTKLIKMVDVRDSSISGAGRGLFANKAIKANTIISFYPVHALGCSIDRPFTTSIPDDETYFQTTPTSQSVYLHCTDQPIFRRTSLIDKQIEYGHERDKNIKTGASPLFLDVNPNRLEIEGWASHIINDGASMNVPGSNSRVEIEQSMLEYYRASKTMKNCIHIPFGPSPIVATVTTRKILKDEELFTTYGGVRFLFGKEDLFTLQKGRVPNRLTILFFIYYLQHCINMHVSGVLAGRITSSGQQL